jgi:hypothetical protein
MSKETELIPGGPAEVTYPDEPKNYDGFPYALGESCYSFDVELVTSDGTHVNGSIERVAVIQSGDNKLTGANSLGTARVPTHHDFDNNGLKHESDAGIFQGADVAAIKLGLGEGEDARRVTLAHCIDKRLEHVRGDGLQYVYYTKHFARIEEGGVTRTLTDAERESVVGIVGQIRDGFPPSQVDRYDPCISQAFFETGVAIPEKTEE